LNQNVKGLIRAVTNNDAISAKKYANIIINSDKTQANQTFCKQMKSALEAPTLSMVELPRNLKLILNADDASSKFNIDRYYVSEREGRVYEQIQATSDVCVTLASIGLPYLNSTLLYGDSGTGKTSFGRYVSHMMGVPFIYLNISYCIDSHLGATGKNIEMVFDYINKTRCVFMLDELDAIGLVRGGDSTVGEMSRVTVSLLQSLDKLGNDVVLIAATNRIEMIDDALRRRFSVEHEVTPLVSDEEVESFIVTFLSGANVVGDMDDITKYVKHNNNRKQSEIVNDIMAAIIHSIKTATPFMLHGTGDHQ
jgi:ATP-dependent 26S proteasome regulatory subunit